MRRIRIVAVVLGLLMLGVTGYAVMKIQEVLLQPEPAVGFAFSFMLVTIASALVASSALTAAAMSRDYAVEWEPIRRERESSA